MNNLELTLWQKKQVALLYYFASTEYLTGLQRRIADLGTYIDSLIIKAHEQRRDHFLHDKKWGRRNTSENWSNHAEPFLADFHRRTVEEIADRSNDVFWPTGSNDCQRGMSEYSLQWATPDEEKAIDSKLGEIASYGSYIDMTMDRHSRASRWNDFGFALAWEEHSTRFPRLPKLLVRTDVNGVNDKRPLRTGVYLPYDDRHGSPQFAWSGNHEGALLECSTFNQIGMDALTAVGRRHLWFDKQKMYAFAMSSQHRALFTESLGGPGECQGSCRPTHAAF